ncbi:chromate transporter [Christiangramia sediminis]|uniref:chromate transporter n=1 Tax=Christiangramia sediminis TaxID=2881336 RepID=UPI00311A951D
MNKLREVAQVFFKLGLIAFGGPAAHIAMMEEEVVTRRNWMSRQHFLDLVGATNLIPGPNSTEMTMHCGYERAGWKGLFVAGICFIFPAVVLTGALAWLYVTYGEIPAVEPFLYGIKPAVLAIILNAIYKLGKKALKNRELAVIGILVIIVSFLGVNEITAILGAGILGLIWFGGIKKFGNIRNLLPISYITFTQTASITSSKIFFVFFKNRRSIIW